MPVTIVSIYRSISLWIDFLIFSLEAENIKSQTAVFAAAKMNNVECLRILLKAGNVALKLYVVRTFMIWKYIAHAQSIVMSLSGYSIIIFNLENYTPIFPCINLFRITII